jgi:hypothetical protein
MEIIWYKNPLATVIKIDDQDRELMRAKIENDTLWGYVYHAQFRANPKLDRYDKDEAIKQLVSIDHDRVDKRVDEMLEFYTADLEGVHIGDCTCVPCSCTKCYAEYMLGVDTIEGLGKHEASSISSAFEKHGDIDAVIESLDNYKVQPFAENKAWHGGQFTEEYYNSWISEWTLQAKRAAEWLKNYKEEHGF